MEESNRLQIGCIEHPLPLIEVISSTYCIEVANKQARGSLIDLDRYKGCIPNTVKSGKVKHECSFLVQDAEFIIVIYKPLALQIRFPLADCIY